MKKILYIFFGLALLVTLHIDAQDLKKELENLIQTDIQFSDFSVKNGINKAFIEFADDSAVLLKPNLYPIIGIDAVKEFHSKIDDSQFTLSWEPLKGEVSKSADLGYSYGIWKLSADSIEQHGTYVSIWKKNPDGKWKYILDSGNEGLGTKIN
ncbi:MAG: hypothetical protein K9H49_13590 [Bacteroidales bacterium]|nr:hypothetical protein [Bacteroidales bacterium]MCF8390486.1 hypothetical protein [Bacteroidales bacterium]